MKNKKGNVVVIAIIVAIVAITAGVIGFLLAKKIQAPVVEPAAQTPVTQSADETTDWKTYTNTQYGYEFKYPSNYNIEQPTQIKDVVVIHIPKKQEYMQIQFFNTEPKINDYEPLGAQLAGDSLLGGKKSLKYHTEKPIILEGTLKDIPYTDYVVVLSKSSYLEISYYGHNNVEASFEKILSTFKFTNAVADETADWKTYKNTENNFEIKYPLGWKTNQANVNQVEFYNSENPKNDYLFRIDVVKNLNKSLNVWLKDNIQDANVENQSVSVAGIEALQFISLPSTQAPGNIEYCFIKNNVGYILTTAYIDTSNGIGEKILSTFKFTN